MAGTRSPFFGDGVRRGAALKQRAVAARAHQAVTKAWEAEIRAAATGSVWRVTAAWVEQACGTRCADLTHISSGKVQTIRLSAGEGIEVCRTRLFGE
jgi:hypothetical protein